MLVKNLTYAEKSDPHVVEFLAALGVEDEYSDPKWPLPNLKEVKEKDFWGWKTCWNFDIQAWGGTVRIDGRWAILMLYWANQNQLIDGGFAVVYFFEYEKEEVRYYKWKACEHEFYSTNIGRCLKQYTCVKCKKSYQVDSSD